MQVRLKKVHQAWNTLYPGEFTVGDIVTLNGDYVTTKSGQVFSATSMCQSFGNGVPYADLFEKLNTK